MIKRVWVSGAQGFTGRPLVAALTRAGMTVCASQVDCRDRRQLSDEIFAFDPEALIHLAAISQPQHQPPDELYAVNVVGTENVLNAAGQLSNMRQIILASSATVYGAAARQYSVLSETIEPQPLGHYALSKLAMEQLAYAYEALPILVLRPFNYTGLGQSDAFLFGKVAKVLGQGLPTLELGNLDLERDFMWLEDVVNVYLSCVTQPSSLRGTFNVCSGVAQSLERLVSGMMMQVDYSVELVSAEHLRRGVEVPTLRGDAARLHNLLGGVPRALSPSMLSSMLDYVKQQVNPQ